MTVDESVVKGTLWDTGRPASCTCPCQVWGLCLVDHIFPLQGKLEFKESSAIGGLQLGFYGGSRQGELL